MKGRVAVVKSYDALNLACFLVGLAVVWFFTRSWLGMFGALVASLHFFRTIKAEQSLASS